MAQRYIFFNSVEGDRRRYQAQDFADYFGSVLSSGLLHTDEVPGMIVSVETGTMNTVISAGRAIMKGHLYENTTPVTLTHAIPESTTDRIDRVILRLDLRNSERNILLHVKEGSPSTSPQAPALIRNDFVYEISLAQVLIRRNTSTLLQTDLVDERLVENLCGLVHSLISIPTDQLQTWITAKIAELDGEMDDALAVYVQALLDAEQQLQDGLADFTQQWDDWFANQQTEGFVMQTEKGVAGGIPVLDGEGKVPLNQLPPRNYVPLSEKGVAGGVATLGSDGKVFRTQIPVFIPVPLGEGTIEFTGYGYEETIMHNLGRIPIVTLARVGGTGSTAIAGLGIVDEDSFSVRTTLSASSSTMTVKYWYY